MTAKKIGELGHGGAGLSTGHQDGADASLKELFLAQRAELDDLRAKWDLLMAKLDADSGVADLNYASTMVLEDAQTSV